MKDKWEPVEPFDIDDGSLAGLALALVFALGVEWAMFRAALMASDGEPFELTVHSANAPRLLAMCERNGRKATRHWIHDDHADWCMVIVKEA